LNFNIDFDFFSETASGLFGGRDPGDTGLVVVVLGVLLLDPAIESVRGAVGAGVLLTPLGISLLGPAMDFVPGETGVGLRVCLGVSGSFGDFAAGVVGL